MSNRTNPELYRARKLAAALRAAKSDHLWTAQECGLLANLCTELGVDAPEHADTVRDGEALAASWWERQRSEKGTLPEGAETPRKGTPGSGGPKPVD